MVVPVDGEGVTHDPGNIDLNSPDNCIGMFVYGQSRSWEHRLLGRNGPAFDSNLADITGCGMNLAQ